VFSLEEVGVEFGDYVLTRTRSHAVLSFGGWAGLLLGGDGRKSSYCCDVLLWGLSSAGAAFLIGSSKNNQYILDFKYKIYFSACLLEAQ